MKLRNSVLWMHKWLALLAGIVWGIAALTGGILIYGREIDRAFNGFRFGASRDTLPPGGLDRALAANFPNETVSSLVWLHEDNVVRLTVRGEAGARREFMDGGTGAVLTDMRPRREVIELVNRLHTDVFARTPGYWLVTLASAAAVLSMITGLYLWWPGIRSFFNGFRVRLKRGAYVLNLDLHQMLGAVTVALLLIMTGTGVLMGVPGVSTRLARWLLPEGPPAAPAVVAPTPDPSFQGPAPGIEALVSAAEQAAGGRIASLAFRDDAPGLVEVRVQPPGELAEQVRVTLARADGRVLDVFDVSDWDRDSRFGLVISRWHTARFAHPVVRAAFAAACFLGVVILLTGLVVWWIKRTRKLAAERQRNAAPA
jgi:uncharacterized iron-regulated membrane protein